MKYFNILQREQFEVLPFVKQNEVLLEKGLFSFVTKTEGLVLSKETIGKPIKLSLSKVLAPSQLLVNEFYRFLLKEYEQTIVNYFLTFSTDLKELTFGLTELEGKRAALKSFKDVFNDLKIDGFHKLKRDYSINGEEIMPKENRMEFLNLRRRAFMKNTANRELLLEYLYGNNGYFNNTLINSDKTIRAFVNFEQRLKVLISLNNEYNFEYDQYFTKAAFNKELFYHYKELDWSFVVFEYVYNKLNSLKSDKNAKAYTSSLYVALEVEKSMNPIPKLYMQFVNEAFGIVLKKINKPPQHENLKHHERVMDFRKELSILEGKD